MADIKVRVGQKNAVKVISSLAGAQALSLPELTDVDSNSFANLYDGMVLVYNASINKWQATLELTPGNTQNLDINGGTF
jgi:hypothetical protein